MPALTPAEAIKPANADAHVSRINREIAGEWSAYDRTYGKTVTLATSSAVIETVEAEFRGKGWEVTRTEEGLRLRPRVEACTSHDC